MDEFRWPAGPGEQPSDAVRQSWVATVYLLGILAHRKVTGRNTPIWRSRNSPSPTLPRSVWSRSPATPGPKRAARDFGTEHTVTEKPHLSPGKFDQQHVRSSPWSMVTHSTKA
ncbi:hypothetical protein ABT275_41785 [Streptomyces sp. NPDC001185]|uniref:hypothetical protein n=1 Tax=Streptomyces sp. NPDC001185 TaxID=3154380 RepID=UPI00332B2FD3